MTSTALSSLSKTRRVTQGIKCAFWLKRCILQDTLLHFKSSNVVKGAFSLGQQLGLQRASIFWIWGNLIWHRLEIVLNRFIVWLHLNLLDCYNENYSSESYKTKENLNSKLTKAWSGTLLVPQVLGRLGITQNLSTWLCIRGNSVLLIRFNDCIFDTKGVLLRLKLSKCSVIFGVYIACKSQATLGWD